MKYQRATEVYQNTAIETADQKTLILLCYDEAIRSLELAKEFYLRKDYEKKAREIIRAQGLIGELLTSLNMEDGGQIAKNLSAIYTFILNQITVADLKQDFKSFDKIMWMLKELRSAWASIEQKPSMEGIAMGPSTQSTRLRDIAV